MGLPNYKVIAFESLYNSSISESHSDKYFIETMKSAKLMSLCRTDAAVAAYGEEG